MPEIYFQPSIVVFADTAGQAIYDLLCSSGQLESVNAQLKNAIGLIYRDELKGELTYTYRLVKDEEEKAEKELLLKDTILRMESKLGPYSASKGYSILTALPAIYIVGLPEARRIVNELRDEAIWDGEISCLFICEPSDQQQVDKHASDEETPEKLVSAKPSTEEWEVWADNQRIIYRL